MHIWKKQDRTHRTLRRQALEIVYRCNRILWLHGQNSNLVTTLEVLNVQRRIARIYSFLRKKEVYYEALLRFQTLNIDEQHNQLYR